MVNINFVMECFNEVLSLKTCWKVFQTDSYTLYTLITFHEISCIIKDTGKTITIELRFYENEKIIIRDNSKSEKVKTRIIKCVKHLLRRAPSKWDYLLTK